MLSVERVCLSRGRSWVFVPRHTKDHLKNGSEFESAAGLSKRPGSVWNCLWGHALKRSPGINRKGRVSYPGPGFISNPTWPSLSSLGTLQKHYNGLNQTKPNIFSTASGMVSVSASHAVGRGFSSRVKPKTI